jgi:uncharacterized membrane protein YdfJ with MMPL/SSD domain
VRVIATGLSFAILLDAFVIRTLVVPALVALMGPLELVVAGEHLARTARRAEPARHVAPTARRRGAGGPSRRARGGCRGDRLLAD